MIQMKAPESNRHGVYEIHDVPGRKIEGLKAKGWLPVEDKTFDLSAGQWFRMRTVIQDKLGLDSAPRTKEQARQLLEEAGYKVIE